MISNFMLPPNGFFLVRQQKKKMILQLERTHFTIWQENHVYLNAYGLHVLNPCRLLSLRQRHVNSILGHRKN